jgi:hypothetical protein
MGADYYEVKWNTGLVCFWQMNVLTLCLTDWSWQETPCWKRWHSHWHWKEFTHQKSNHWQECSYWRQREGIPYFLSRICKRSRNRYIKTERGFYNWSRHQAPQNGCSNTHPRLHYGISLLKLLLPASFHSLQCPLTLSDGFCPRIDHIPGTQTHEHKKLVATGACHTL